MDMREIKFRTWDKEDKRMFNDVDVLKNGSIIYFETDEYGEPIHWHNNFDHNYDEKFSNVFEVMQYTGLKDKNGKEIYEGDIVRYKQRNLEKAFGINDGEDYDVKTKEIVYMDQSFNVPWGFIKDLEVIGNIYEGERNVL